MSNPVDDGRFQRIVDGMDRADGLTRSPEDLELLLLGMERAANAFYAMAVRLNFHEFVEFTGFMNEYVKICRRCAKAGIDFTQHPPELASYEAAYLGEKFGCIFGLVFRMDPTLIEQFCLSAFGRAPRP